MARGAKIYAEVVGYGMTADAYHMSAPLPNHDQAQRSMRIAMERAGINVSDVDYINAHGTSTPMGDVCEVRAVKAVLGDHAKRIPVSSTKSMTGHSLGAAGAIEVLACILAVTRDIIPPTINHFTDDPGLDPKLNFTFNKAQHRTVNAALSNTFGFGGHNASVIVKKYIA